jgi:hypothetical protein
MDDVRTQLSLEGFHDWSQLTGGSLSRQLSKIIAQAKSRRIETPR